MDLVVRRPYSSLDAWLREEAHLFSAERAWLVGVDAEPGVTAELSIGLRGDDPILTATVLVEGIAGDFQGIPLLAVRWLALDDASRDTLQTLLQRFPRAHFVWLMGADNLVQLPRWRRWRAIAAQVAFAVLPRPPYNHRALASQAAHRLAAHRLPAHAAATLAGLPTPRWVFLPTAQNATSATAIRLNRSS